MEKRKESRKSRLPKDFVCLDALVDNMCKGFLLVFPKDRRLNSKLECTNCHRANLYSSLPQNLKSKFDDFVDIINDYESELIEFALVTGFNYAVYCNEVAPYNKLPKIERFTIKEAKNEKSKSNY